MSDDDLMYQLTTSAPGARPQAGSETIIVRPVKPESRFRAVEGIMAAVVAGIGAWVLILWGLL